MSILNVKVVSSQKSDKKTKKPLYWEKRVLEKSDQVKSSNAVRININPDVEYQECIGFGGSFTESSAYNIAHLNKKNREKVINAYFSDRGLGYTLCRTHMQSCDFSLGSYSYVVDKNDTTLDTFSIARDKVYLLPFIKLAQKMSATPFKIMASPWSPPAFMKTNHSMSYGGKIKQEYASRWALMYTKYLQAYKNEGVDIWGISVQNEPEAKQTWDSCLYSAEEEGDFIYNYLVPALKKHKFNPHIIAWDHNRDNLFTRAKKIYNHPASKYIWGSGFHWYEEISTGYPMHKEVEKTHKQFPEKHLIMTEGCQELVGLGVKMGDWSIGERYARNIIGDLNAWCEGWIDWNMVLNAEGGPNHVQNLCDALIKVNTRTQEIIYANSYYYMGHFSKFIRPHAKRIKHTLNHDKVMATTWKEGNNIICVMLNTSEHAYPISLKIGKSYINTVLESHAIQTVTMEIKA